MTTNKQSWIDIVLETFSGAETPEKFKRWACLACLSAVAKRKIYLPRGDDSYIYYKLYPNISAMIISQSSVDRKTFATSIAENMMEYVPSVLTISGRNTIESIVQDLQAVRQDKDGLHTVKADGSCFLISGEWTNLIMENASALTQMNDLLDSHYRNHWDYRTKTAGKFQLPKPYVTMFGATTSEQLDLVVQKKDIVGGFFARTLVISTVDKIRINSLTSTTGRTVNFESLAIHLNKIATLAGEFVYGNGAAEYFDQWYRGFMSQSREELSSSDPTNMIYKSQDHVLRVAMLLALAELEPKLIIETHHLEQSIALVAQCLADSRRALFKLQKESEANAITDAMKEVFYFLLQEYETGNKAVTRARLGNRFYGRYSGSVLDQIETTLVQAGMIDSEEKGRDRILRIKKEQVMRAREKDSILKQMETRQGDRRRTV